MKNLDTLVVHAPTHGNASSCLTRVQVARWAMLQNGFTPNPKLGSIWLWDEATNSYDTVHDFHCWMWVNASLYDSYAAMKRALMILAQNGEGFTISKPMEKWKAAELRHKTFANAKWEEIPEMISSFRAQGIDIIYLQDVVAPHMRKEQKKINIELYSEPIFE